MSALPEKQQEQYDLLRDFGYEYVSTEDGIIRMTKYTYISDTRTALYSVLLEKSGRYTEVSP